MVQEIKKVDFQENAANLQLLDKITGLDEKDAERLAYKEGKRRVVMALRDPAYRYRTPKREQERLARQFSHLAVTAAKERRLLKGQTEAAPQNIFNKIKAFIKKPRDIAIETLTLSIAPGRVFIRLLAVALKYTGQRPTSLFTFMDTMETREIDDKLQPGKSQVFYRYKVFLQLVFILTIEAPRTKWTSIHTETGDKLHSAIAGMEQLHPRTGCPIKGFFIDIGNRRALWR